MFQLVRPSKNLLSLVFLTLGFATGGFAQETSLGTEVQEYQNLEDAALDAKPAEPETPAASPAEEAVISSEPMAQPESQTPSQEITPDSQARSPQVDSSFNENQTATPEVAPVVTDAPDKKVEEQVAQVEKAPGHESDRTVVGTYGGRIFGRHKIQLAANRPTFNEGQRCYEKFYGKPETHMTFSGEWFPLDWWINPGIYTRLGVYSARGKAVSGSPETTASTDCEKLTVDGNSSTGLLFMPIQLGAKIQFSPFRRKWLVIDYWTGAELDWWQETRNESASMATLTTLAASNEQVYTTTGRKRSISAGASVHLLLNPLDESTVRSMISTMGLGYVYLSGFMETVKSTSQGGLTFGRKVVGMGFTFEAYK